MNDIYWHDKRTMPSKQLSSPPPTQPRRSYENTLRTKQYQPMDIRLNTRSTTGRTVPSPYLQYPTTSNRPYSNHNNNTNGNFTYTSSLHGVYRQSSPPPPPRIITSPSHMHASQNIRIDLRDQSHRSQAQQLSRSASDDYYYSTKYQDLQGRNGEVYDDEEENENGDEENSSEVFNYSFDDAGVSLIERTIYQ
jgi:hypothetical protein